VQILVIVAIIRTRCSSFTRFVASKTVVEEVSLSIANKQGSASPYQQVNSVNADLSAKVGKGKQVNIPVLFGAAKRRPTLMLTRLGQETGQSFRLNSG
jgi:hypothetical protein